MYIGENYICIKSFDQFKIGQIYTISKFGTSNSNVFKFDKHSDIFIKNENGNIVRLIEEDDNINLFNKLRTHNLNIINETT